MIGAVSSLNSYGRVQWQSYGSADTAAQKTTVHAVGKGSDPEVPVQPVDAATPVTPKASGSVGISSLSPQAGAETAELAVRMRISPEETVQGAQKGEEKIFQLIGQENKEKAVQGREEEPENDLAVQRAEREAKKEERIQAEQEAKEQKKAFLETVKEAEETRSERIAALKEAMAGETGKAEAEEEGSEKQTESAAEGESQEAEEGQQSGFLTLDHTAAMLQNFQMTNLLQEKLSAQARGENTSGYSAAIEALMENSQPQVRFVSGEDENNQRSGNYFLSGAA